MLFRSAEATADAPRTSETLAGLLHASLSADQRRKVCFPWDHVHPKFGLLRTRVANNWNVTEPAIAGDFFTADQRRLIREIFEQLIAPEWHARFDKQLEDDTGGFGHGQSIALIGEPGSGRFQFLLTGRHMTLRCDGDSSEHVAFGGDEGQTRVVDREFSGRAEIPDQDPALQQLVDHGLQDVVAAHEVEQRPAGIAHMRSGGALGRVREHERSAAGVLVLQQDDGLHRGIHAGDHDGVGDVAEREIGRAHV